MRVHLSTKDSYTCGNGQVMSKEDLFGMIRRHGFNRYSGGRQDSFGTICDQQVVGYSFKKCLKISYSSKEECREVEDYIRPLFDVFHPRLFTGEVIG